MKKRVLSTILIGAMATTALLGCGSSGETYDAKTVLQYNDYDVTEYVNLCDTSEIDISAIAVPEEITDDYVKSYLDYMLESYPDYVVSEHKTIKQGDAVNIDYVGTIDGEEFDGGSGEDYFLEIGSGMFIEGFESGLIDHKKGDTVELALTFPDDYGDENCAGKDVLYSVTINGIYDANYLTSDTVTNEYISENFGYDTVDDYLAYLKEYLVSASEYDYEYSVQSAIVEQFEEKSEIQIPDGFIDSEMQFYETYYTSMAEDTNQTLDEYTKENLGYDSFDLYKTDLEPQIESQAKEDLIFQALALELDVSFTEKEFDDFVEQKMKNNDVTKEELYMMYGGSKEKAMVVYLESLTLDVFSTQLKESLPTSETFDGSGSAG